MRTIVPLAAAAALLLSVGCSAGQPSGSHRIRVAQPDTTRADSIAPASSPPVLATPPASTRPAATHPVSRASSAPSSTSVTPPHTEQVIRRPVTRTGRVAPGYTLVVLPADPYQLDCGGSRGAFPASSAVDDGIASCVPSVAYAVACWNGPTATTALCYRNAWQHQVDLINTYGRLPAEQAPKQPTPLGLVLSDGTRCWVRDGGAWAALDGHPELVGVYSCGQDAVWATPLADGINRTRPLWSVRVAPMSGHGKLRTVAVRTAYFVGTSRS
jgi:hypothetical protein